MLMFYLPSWSIKQSNSWTVLCLQLQPVWPRRIVQQQPVDSAVHLSSAPDYFKG